MKFLVIQLSLIIILHGCASYQSGNVVEVISGDHPVQTPIRASLEHKLSTDYYRVINFSFGNKTNNWLRVKKVRLSFIDAKANENINIVLGQDISTWAEAIKHKGKIDQWNSSIILGSIALTGGAIMSSGIRSGNSTTVYAGLGAYTAASGIQVANNMVDEIGTLERAKLFPRNHLYQPFSVPAGLFVNRWILLQVKQGELPRKLFFDIEYLDGKKAKYSVNLK